MKGQDVLDRLAGREFTEKGFSQRDYFEIIKLIKTEAISFLKQHNHIELQKDSEHVLWVVCLDCGRMWTHCDFCKRGVPRLRQAYIDFHCKWKCKEGVSGL